MFRRKYYVKPKSQATAKHKCHRLVFDSNTMKLSDFLEKLNQGVERTFGENAKSMIDSLLYAKLLQTEKICQNCPSGEWNIRRDRSRARKRIRI